MGAPLRIVIGGRKGGIGKTAVTVNAADELAHRGMKVLVVDMDPQACATAHVGVNITDETMTMSDVLYSAHVDGAMDDAIVETPWAGVWLAPAEEELASREADRVASSELRLRRVLRTADVAGFDVILIDSPPSLGPLFLMGLNAADRLVVVTDSERGGLDGVGRAIDAARIVAEDSNPNLSLAGVVMNMFHAGTTEHAARWVELEQLYPDLPRWRLPQRAAVATAYGASVPTRAIGGSGAPVYTVALADFVTGLLNGRQPDGSGNRLVDNPTGEGA